ncbi:hypothetical protein [Haloferax volcanii]|uniref:hypothetical protein n=1 Tax=Haloferax volcanii TaxID=2246 RepID=UPI00249BACA1|nr:hypothetical protein [Haloferax alexandrinus]WEL29875.1 hypothetical protein HBNXHx_1769 [Haloferax alexandrinus]
MSDQSVEERLDELEAENAALRQDMQGLISQHKQALGRITELEDEVERLEDELESVRDSEELLKSVRKNGATTTEERAAVLVDVMAMRASARDPPRYELDASGIVDVLHGSIKRPNTYGLMDDVERIVDRPNVVWKQTESRSSRKNTRLVLDLSKGDLPTQIAGQTIEVTTA